MNKGEPPSECGARSFPLLVGKSSRGHWVVRSQDGLCGGLFVNRAEAVRFALFENGHHRDGLVMVSGVLELNLSDPRSAGAAARNAAQTPKQTQNTSIPSQGAKEAIRLPRFAPALA
jgi:hypothetical protein